MVIKALPNKTLYTLIMVGFTLTISLLWEQVIKES